MKKTAMMLAFIIICPVWAAAADTQVLPKVLVTAGRIEEKTTSVTQAVTIISREEIAKNQHRDLGGLLSQYGVQVDSTVPNSSFSQIAIRGMRTNLFGDDLQSAVLVLVDGRRYGTSNISLIPMVNIERIEILRGPAAVQYGTASMGGAVNIITRRGSKEPSAMAEIGAGSFETLRSQGEISGYLNGFDYALGASLLSSDDFKTGSGRSYENTSLGRKVGYSANLGYTFAEDQRIGVIANGVDADQMGSPDDIRALNPVADNDRYNYSFDFNYEGAAKPYGLSWQGRYFISRGNYVNRDPINPWGSTFYQSRTELQGAQGQMSFTKKILTLTGGVDWNKYDLRDSSSGESTYKNISYFALAKLAFMDELIIINGGVRYDDYTLEMNTRDDDLSNTSPSVGIAINPLSFLTIRANYGESFIVPTTQQFLGFQSMWGNYLANPNLDPEKGTGWDAGIDLHYNAFNFVFSYFQTDYENKIATRYIGADSQYYNIGGESKYRGIESEIGLDIGALMDWPLALRPYANLTHMLKYEDANGNTLKNVSKLDLAYGLAFSHPELGLDVDLRFVYFGAQEVNDYNPASGSSTAGRIGGRTTADLYISKTILEDDEIGTFRVKAELRNILDKDYYLTKEYPMPGRSFWLGLRYDY